MTALTHDAFAGASLTLTSMRTSLGLPLNPASAKSTLLPYKQVGILAKQHTNQSRGSNGQWTLTTLCKPDEGEGRREKQGRGGSYNDKSQESLALLIRGVGQGGDLKRLVDALPEFLGLGDGLEEEAIILHPRHTKGVGHGAHLSEYGFYIHFKKIDGCIVESQPGSLESGAGSKGKRRGKWRFGG